MSRPLTLTLVLAAALSLGFVGGAAADNFSFSLGYSSYPGFYGYGACYPAYNYTVYTYPVYSWPVYSYSVYSAYSPPYCSYPSFYGHYNIRFDYGDHHHRGHRPYYVRPDWDCGWRRGGHRDWDD